MRLNRSVAKDERLCIKFYLIAVLKNNSRSSLRRSAVALSAKSSARNYFM